MKRVRNILQGAVLLCALTVLCHGRVFERSGTVTDSTKVLLSIGGTVAYESPVSINGHKGELAVVGFNKSMPSLIRELGKAFNTSNIVYAGGTMGFITANADGFILKLTVLKLGDNNQTIVFKIFQTESESKAAAAPPARQQMKEMPSFPGSEPIFFARDEKSNAGLAVSQTTADAASIHNYFAAQLTSAGWSTTLPGGSPGRPQSLLMYSKGHEICCIMVDSSRTEGKNRITLLHKQQGIE